LLHRITKEVRRNVPKDFIVAIKLNCGDFVDRQAAEQSDGRVLQYVQEIVNWGLIDLLEITGGDYENPGSRIYVFPPISLGTGGG
jgi:2,4-dienoyl-CoA reductase-like NADH-dependent reductase (Old Yellow Enzyme family)